ncbi:hypothetical protein Tco_0043643, partial [Tanacetum coccineum]
MNLGTSSQPQQCLRDTPSNLPPHLPTQASQSESSPSEKEKREAKEENPDQRKSTSHIPGRHKKKKNFWPKPWDVLKNHHKWRGVKAVVPGRRVRTAEDIEEPNELFRGDTIPHPPGKPMPSKI